MESKGVHLHIRASETQKAILARAAELRHTTVSKFVLDTALPLAEEIVKQDEGEIQTSFRLMAEDWKKFCEVIDAPVRDLPELRKLLSQKAPWE